VTHAQRRELLHALEAKLEHYVWAWDAADAAEAAVPQPTAAALRETIQHLRERKGRYEQVRAAREASGESQVSLTNPDSRAMPQSPTGDGGYNVQTAVDAKPKLIVEQHVTNAVTAVDQLSALAITTKETLGVEHLKVVADRGYDHGEAIKACEEAGIEPYIPKPLTSANRTVVMPCLQDTPPVLPNQGANPMPCAWRKARIGTQCDRSEPKFTDHTLTAHMDRRRFMAIKAVEEQAGGSWDIGNRGHAIRLPPSQDNARGTPPYIWSVL
jgi:hypothetical protein